MSWLSELGIDEERFHWVDLAACQGIDTTNFFENYESSATTRAAVDEMCAACPVRRQCLMTAIENKDSGVHGGWYLDGSGGVNKNHTAHKTPEDYDDLKELITNE